MTIKAVIRDLAKDEEELKEFETEKELFSYLKGEYDSWIMHFDSLEKRTNQFKETDYNVIVLKYNTYYE